MKEFILEFIEFIKHRKRYWITPIFLFLLLLSALVVLGQGTAVAPFVYTIF